ncbi:MgtC/SapB family protein [Candidatus Bipolaricaulota bacterium]|nr:MgtC/SapB family protein [Candidatus Bipolaricaulota bacterium]
MDELALLLRVLVAAALSAVIGLERELHGRPAGLRTHLLVGVGAALVMAAFEAATIYMGSPSDALRIDPGRLAAGVITGIGFLGAGTILKVGDWVRGLTTAASLWFVAMLGIVAGQGLYILAIGGCASGLAILSLIDPLAAHLPHRTYHTLELTVTLKRREAVEDTLNELLVGSNRKRAGKGKTRITRTSWRWDGDQQMVTLSYRIRHDRSAAVEEAIEQLSRQEGVVRADLHL